MIQPFLARFQPLRAPDDVAAASAPAGDAAALPSGTPSVPAEPASPPTVSADGASTPTSPASAPLVPEAAPAATPESPAPKEGAVKPAAAAEPAKPSLAPLLSEAGKSPAPDAQPALDKPEKAAEQAAAPAQQEAPVERPPAPTFQLTLPEGVTLPQEQLGQFTDVLGNSLVDLQLAQKAGTPEAITAATQAMGQKLMDLYLADAKARETQALSRQQEVWDGTRQQWLDAVKADPELGGNRIETVLKTAGSVIEQFAGPKDGTGMVSPEQVAELREALRITGAEFHPAIVRFVYTVGKALGEGRPIAAHKPTPPQASRAERRYSARSNGAAA